MLKGNLNRLLNEIDTSEEQYNSFYHSAYVHFKDCSKLHHWKKFSFTNLLVFNAVWIDATKWEHPAATKQ